MVDLYHIPIKRQYVVAMGTLLRNICFLSLGVSQFVRPSIFLCVSYPQPQPAGEQAGDKKIKINFKKQQLFFTNCVTYFMKS